MFMIPKSLFYPLAHWSLCIEDGSNQAGDRIASQIEQCSKAVSSLHELVCATIWRVSSSSIPRPIQGWHFVNITKPARSRDQDDRKLVRSHVMKGRRNNDSKAASRHERRVVLPPLHPMCCLLVETGSSPQWRRPLQN